MSVALASMVFLGYSYFIEPNTISVESLELDLDCAQNAGKEDRFVQISDLHFTDETRTEKITEILNSVNLQKPSAVFITGDLISEKNGIDAALELVGKLSGKYPTYVVFGNWDYWSLDFDVNDFSVQLENSGAKLLINKNTGLEVNNNLYHIAGVKDPYTSGENLQDVAKALSGINPRADECKILLAHSPNVIKYAKNRGIDLILAGHTHGGQIFIPFITDYFIPSRREAGRGYISGLYSINSDKMYVNRGIGVSVIPLRFMAPPELTVIKIR